MSFRAYFKEIVYVCHMDYKEKLQSMSGFIGDVRKIPKEINKHTKMLCWKYNQTSPLQIDDRMHILKELFGSYEDTTVVQPPVWMDFGFNIHFRGWAYINYGCVFLDTSPIMIGEGVFIAPGVILTCATHPVDEKQRVDEGLEISKPIVLGDHVWIGAHSTICGGVSIGHGSVIGAGSVVLHDIPSGAIAVGVPCKVIRMINAADRISSEQIDF